MSVSFMVIEGICDSFLKIGIDIGSMTDKVNNDILYYLYHSKRFYDSSYIVQQFMDCLNKEIENGRVACGENETENNKPVIYAKKELILIGVKTFAKFEQMIPYGIIDKTDKSNGVRLRNILSEEGCLVTNNGDKMLYKASVSKSSSERMNFVALKRSVFSEEARKYLPKPVEENVSSAEYNPPDLSDGLERILFGTTTDTNQPVYWNLESGYLMNKHILIQADSGSGKTTLMFLLAQRLFKRQKKVLILDYAEKTSFSASDIQTMDNNFIRRIGRSVFEKGINEESINHMNRCDLSQDKLNEELLGQSTYTEKIHDDTVNVMSQTGITVIRCTSSTALDYLKALFLCLTENNCWQRDGVYVILDEINSLNIQDEQVGTESKRSKYKKFQSVLDMLFRQGRAIGMNIISATQFFADKGSTRKMRLFYQSATRIVLHMNITSSSLIAKTISFENHNYYREVLEKLQVGQALIVSGVECYGKKFRNDLPLKIQISPIDDQTVHGS